MAKTPETRAKASTAARNIVILLDGTGNELGRNLSNVLKLYRIAEKNEGQLCYYAPGVGTISRINPWARARQRVNAVLGLATGYGLDENVLGAYRFLVEHWRDGDRVFIFGFSRGAWTARVLAGMVHLIGLLKPEQINMSDAALGAYKAVAGSKRPKAGQTEADAKKESFEPARQFSRVMGVRHIPIAFLGAWDSVSSVLVPRPDRLYLPSRETLPYTRTNPSVAVFRHALALDERRSMYRVADWVQPQSYDPNPFDTREPVPQDIKQVWFPGVHSDIGGGYPEEESALSKLALEWMVGEAKAAGLRTNTSMFNHLVLGKPRKGSSHEYVAPDPKGKLHRSLAWLWWILEIVPKRTKYREWAGRPGLLGLYLPLSEPRKVPEGHEIDPSVASRMDAMPGYRPPNIPR